MYQLTEQHNLCMISVRELNTRDLCSDQIPSNKQSSVSPATSIIDKVGGTSVIAFVLSTCAPTSTIEAPVTVAPNEFNRRSSRTRRACKRTPDSRGRDRREDPAAAQVGSMAQEKKSRLAKQQNSVGEKGKGGRVGREFSCVAPSRPSLRTNKKEGRTSSF
jgi:hypothetical protein